MIRYSYASALALAVALLPATVNAQLTSTQPNPGVSTPTPTPPPASGVQNGISTAVLEQRQIAILRERLAVFQAQQSAMHRIDDALFGRSGAYQSSTVSQVFGFEQGIDIAFNGNEQRNKFVEVKSYLGLQISNYTRLLEHLNAGGTAVTRDDRNAVDNAMIKEFSDFSSDSQVSINKINNMISDVSRTVANRILPAPNFVNFEVDDRPFFVNGISETLNRAYSHDVRAQGIAHATFSGNSLIDTASRFLSSSPQVPSTIVTTPVRPAATAPARPALTAVQQTANGTATNRPSNTLPNQAPQANSAGGIAPVIRPQLPNAPNYPTVSQERRDQIAAEAAARRTAAQTQAGAQQAAARDAEIRAAAQAAERLMQVERARIADEQNRLSLSAQTRASQDARFQALRNNQGAWNALTNNNLVAVLPFIDIYRNYDINRHPPAMSPSSAGTSVSSAGWSPSSGGMSFSSVGWSLSLAGLDYRDPAVQAMNDALFRLVSRLRPPDDPNLGRTTVNALQRQNDPNLGRSNVSTMPSLYPEWNDTLCGR